MKRNRYNVEITVSNDRIHRVFDIDAEVTNPVTALSNVMNSAFRSIRYSEDVDIDMYEFEAAVIDVKVSLVG